MERTLEPEWLDELSPEDSRAQRSRRDLRRLNAIMGHAREIARELRSHARVPVKRMCDLGSGDGLLLLDIAQQLGWHGVELRMVDTHPSMSPATAAAFTELDWNVTAAPADVFAALEQSDRFDVITTNLFLHHFGEEQLRRMLSLIAQRCALFVACETRRSAVACLASKAVGLLGCNDVTRHDAVLSVRAGFRRSELSALWPEGRGWTLMERRSGLFSHLFIAKRL